jgi:thymidylate kinase
MKTILITGLDGSGKSTVFEKIKQQTETSKVKFIFVPHIDLSELMPESEEYKVATFVNELGELADKEQLPQIKAIALFSAMLLFQKIEKYLASSKPQIIYFERHPLIDTPIYAQFYAPKLAQNEIPQKIISYIETKYHSELDSLIRLLPRDSKILQKPQLSILTEFIYTWFHLQKKHEITDLQKLFGVELPSKIYYLKADASVLYQRVKDRKRKEAHENEHILSKLADAYELYLSNLLQKQPNKIEFVDANNIQSLNHFAEKLISK